jgi:hypothetical protein
MMIEGFAIGATVRKETYVDDDILRKAAGAAMPAADHLGGLTRGSGDPVGETLRRAAEGAATGRHALELAAAGGLDPRLASARGLLAGHDFGLTSETLRAAAAAGATLPSAADMLRIAGVDAAALSGAFAPGAEMRSLLGATAEAQRIHAELFRMPRLDELAKLTEAASTGALARAAFGADLSGLRTAMDAVRTPWLQDGRVMESALGFGELQAMGALLTGRPPFAETVSAALRLDLGDWRDELAMPIASLRDAAERSRFYVGRGLNRALTHFTPQAFDENLQAAGLADPAQGPPTGTDDGEEAGLARAKAAFDRLQRFEREVRRFVDRVMREAFGEAWIKQRTPAGMRDHWIQKRETAIARGETAGPLIDYADFTDYKAIIERADNWNAVFRHVFERPEDVRESFQRLFPVRICTMHARTVTLDDEIYLVSETTRLLRAIRRAP